MLYCYDTDERDLPVLCWFGGNIGEKLKKKIWIVGYVGNVCCGQRESMH